MTKEYVVFDFETTGFSAQKNEIIQIGAIRCDENHQEIGRFNQLIKPQRSYVSSEISALTGIYARDLLDEPVIEDVLPDFLAFIKGALLVAHNTPFDVGFLYQAIIDCGIREVERFEVYDTLTEARRLLKAKSYKLENLKDFLGISVRSHDALNDCLVTVLLYQHLQEIEHPKTTLSLSENSDEQLSLFTRLEDEGITEEVRRKLGLPVTKALVYYKLDQDKKWQVYDVIGIAINQEYSTGFSLCLTLFNEDKVNIHSDFLVQMQKKNFMSEMTE